MQNKWILTIQKLSNKQVVVSLLRGLGLAHLSNDP